MLTTDRLILRPTELSDFDAMLAFAQSERTRFVGGKAPRFDVWRALLTGIGHWQVRGYGLFTALSRESGAPVGRIGPLFHDGWEEPELSWHVYDGYEGQGLAYEAARAARRWYHDAISPQPLISYIHHENPRSQALAHRLGAVLEREGELLGTPCQVWRHPGRPA